MDKKLEKRKKIINVLKTNFEMHLAHMKSAQESTESFAEDLIGFLNNGKLPKKTRKFVEFEIRHNWEDYEEDKEQ